MIWVYIIHASSSLFPEYSWFFSKLREMVFVVSLEFCHSYNFKLSHLLWNYLIFYLERFFYRQNHNVAKDSFAILVLLVPPTLVFRSWRLICFKKGIKLYPNFVRWSYRLNSFWTNDLVICLQLQGQLVIEASAAYLHGVAHVFSPVL